MNERDDVREMPVILGVRPSDGREGAAVYGTSPRIGERAPRSLRSAGLLAALVLAACGTPAPLDPAVRVEFVEPHMGTEFRIVMWAPDAERAGLAARAAFARIAALDATLSDWQPASEASRLCRAPRATPIAVSEDLFAVLSRSLELAALTDGAFDPTVGPCVVLWRRAVRERELPTPARLARARDSVGTRLVELDRERRTVTLHADGMRLDFGAIGEGHAADAALRVLAEHGIARALVDAGGDVAVGDAPPGEDGWLVALQHAAADESAPQAIRVARCGVCTSGDLFRFVEIEGRRYSHVIDPRTGLGVTTRGAATVVASDAATADALATAACVLEPTAALAAVARIEGASVYLTRQLDERAIEAVSPTFPERRTRPERAPSAHRFGAWKAAFASWYRVASDARGSSRPVASHSLRP